MEDIQKLRQEIIDITETDGYKSVPSYRKLQIKKFELLIELNKVEALKEIKNSLDNIVEELKRKFHGRPM